MEKKQAHNILSNSLYLVIAGTDDLANTYFSTGVGRLEYDIGAYTNLMVDSAFNFIKVRVGVYSNQTISNDMVSGMRLIVLTFLVFC